MRGPKQYGSALEMTQTLSDDRAFPEELTKRLFGRQLIKTLTVLRERAGLSQQELAKKLKCTQSKVSKLEGSDDADVRFGDLVRYAEAVSHEMHVRLTPRGQSLPSPPGDLITS